MPISKWVSQKEREEDMSTHVWAVSFSNAETPWALKQAPVKPPLSIITFDIVAFALTLLRHNLPRNSCISKYNNKTSTIDRLKIHSLNHFWDAALLNPLTPNSPIWHYKSHCFLKSCNFLNRANFALSNQLRALTRRSFQLRYPINTKNSAIFAKY